MSESAHYGWNLQHSYLQSLPELVVEQAPVPVAAPQLYCFNQSVAEDLGLSSEAWRSGDGAAWAAGNQLPPGARPLAQAYAGHQFGHATMLGDGRAILLGEQQDPQGQLWDIQLKGSGRTPFSRGGDGRAALRPMLREYLISEAMHGLGIATTRSLAVATTGETVQREYVQPGAILARVARSHIRVGTFFYTAAQNDPKLLQRLADYTIARHFPECADAAHPYRALLAAAIEQQSALIAQWMLVGFIHGVMNTDNMALSGETIDYGPCAFMDTYHPSTVYSSIDRQGRYAYGQQPAIGHWNLARFAETLLPLLAEDQPAQIAQAEALLGEYPQRYQDHWLAGMRAKLGLLQPSGEDMELTKDLLQVMETAELDYTNTFLLLAQTIQQANGVADMAPELAAWINRWQAHREQLNQDPQQSAQRMAAVNPQVIPRNHQVEAALRAAEDGDLQPFEQLQQVLRQPYHLAAADSTYQQPASAEQQASYRTFCGT